MKAIIVTRSGGPEVLQVQDIPGPEPKENQVLVNVKVCGVNFADILMANGTYAAGPKPPFIAGREFSGKVLSTGEDVMGYVQANGFAERIVSRREFLWKMPNGWTYEQGAAFPVNYFTAFFAYWWAGLWAPTGMTPSRISKGNPSVLIQASAGGVGTAAVQIGRLLGVEMYGTSSSDEKLARARELGLTHSINYKNQDYEDYIQRATKGEGVDAVFDMLGGEHTIKASHCVKFGGRVIVYGSASGKSHQFDTRSIYAKNAAIHGLWLSPLSMHREYMEPAWKQLSEWIAQGNLQPQIGHVYPAEKAPDAFRAMLERKNYGKLVLTF
jgi:NADPH2:quinone reductase